MEFKLKSAFKPAGSQPEAVERLVEGVNGGMQRQTLLGVTGSGKTFTMANVIERMQKPTLVIAHNKTLTAQLAQEYKEFFPENAVHYFVSYYDYYQPEAYLPVTDTYIEKDAQINEEIDRLRHASTQALLTRRDVIIVASVSCIYGIGSPVEYAKQNITIKEGDRTERRKLVEQLVAIHYERTNSDLEPGTFRLIGNSFEVMAAAEKVIYVFSIQGGRVTPFKCIDAISRALKGEKRQITLFPAKHFVTEKEQQRRALKTIRLELEEQLKKFKRQEKLLEAERLKRRTRYDLAMIREIGYCNGIENYSRHLSGKLPGEPPDTLLSYFPRTAAGKPDFLTIIDESHVTLPQLRGMQAGDASRKQTLIEHGFRLPSALDNRPLTFDEFEERVGTVIYTSATPDEYERATSDQIVEQIVRPTGLLDPELSVRGIEGTGTYPGQIQDFIAEAAAAVARGGRAIATTLTKRMAEDLSQYLKEHGVRAEYLHGDIKTIERIKILSEFRRGAFDCLVGVNLLREGLDLPEVVFIGILDADKEGFLRSETSLIQIIGRAARNVSGKVVLYADRKTASIIQAMDETDRRRKLQVAYNAEHGITPQTIVKKIHDITEELESAHEKTVRNDLAVDLAVFGDKRARLVKLKEKQMRDAVRELDFETAAILRDEIEAIRGIMAGRKPRTRSKLLSKKTERLR